MKKIMSIFLSAVFALSAFGTGVTVSAKEIFTPSGIPYGEIGNELDKYVETYKAGLASCEVAVFDGSGIITV